MTAPAVTASPCIRLCRLDGKRSRCLGCGRTTAEIARWPQATEAEREAIVQAAAARQANTDAH